MSRTGYAIALVLLVPVLAGCLQPDPAAQEIPLASMRAQASPVAEPAPHGDLFGLAPPTTPLTRSAAEGVAGAATTEGTPDPLALGPYGVTRHEYDFGLRPHVFPDRPSAYLLTLRGSLHLPDGDGPFPVILFQHGRHATCALAGRESLGPAGQCPRLEPVAEPVDSYAGYDYIAENLASHGYVVASVDANSVNDLDGSWATNADAGAQARADIVLATLDRLRELHASPHDADWGSLLAGRLDLSRVGLMGHSRGGEGVTHAVLVNGQRPEGERHALRAVFAIAPIDATGARASGVAFATILPYCDGDVASLSGARIYDASRNLPGETDPKVQILVMGANHNHYNTVWWADDARYGSDPACGPSAKPRLSPQDQRKEGLAHVAGFLRLHVGDETAFAPLFDGTGALPPAACPGGVECPGLAHVSRAPPTADRLPLAIAGATGFTVNVSCKPAECAAGARVVGSATRQVLAWRSPATLTLSIPPGTDAGAWDALVVRMAVDPGAAENRNRPAQDARIVLVDEAGNAASVDASAHSRALYVPPGLDNVRKIVLNDVRIPLDAVDGVDLASLREARLVFDLTPMGRVHVADAMLVR